jgi:hypothetical protein
VASEHVDAVKEEIRKLEECLLAKGFQIGELTQQLKEYQVQSAEVRILSILTFHVLFIWPDLGISMSE